MQVTLMCEDRLYSVLLPEKIRGRYWIEDEELEAADRKRRLIGIEGENGKWKITAGRRLRLYDGDWLKPVSLLELVVGKMYPVELQEGRKAYIFTESYTEDRCTFKKYVLDVNVTINIGKNSDNAIIIDNPYVSPIHAQLSLTNDVWTIYDNDSQNGIYINGRRMRRSAMVYPGDMIYILGVKIVVGYHFLALNNPDGTVKLSNTLKEYQPEKQQPYEAPEEIEEKIYYRSPIFGRKIVPLSLKIDAPTTQERTEDTPLILALGPSLVMGAASFSTGILSMTTTARNGGNVISAIPAFIMSLSMLAGMVLFPLIIKKRDQKKKKEREQERRTKYVKYLENIRTEIRRTADMQKEILKENYPLVLSQMKQSNFFDTQLWNRVIGHENFLRLRVGVGNIPLQAEIAFPEQRFSIDDDVMRDEVARFSEEKQMLSGAPLVYSLLEHRVSGIVGSSQGVNGMLNHLILQVAALHSYDEVKLVFLCDEVSMEKYDYVRWMPHIWDDSFKRRFLATNQEEIRELSVYLLKEMEKYQGEQSRKSPYYIVISTSKALSDTCVFLTELLKHNTQEGFSYIAVYDELKNLPKECTAVFQVNNTQGMMFDYNAAGGSQINFVQDIVTREDVQKAVMQIAEYKLDLQGGKYALPDMLTFLDMLKVGKYEHLNITSRWRASNPFVSLQAPVGVNSDGGLFYLDLHEGAHGPHGLIAGMTGSGKSEFIITFILSLAVNYSPKDVAFILIDYKGGGLAGAFDSDQYHLPHLAGTITNLDGTAITRSLLSIQSELKRRQRVFAEARRRANEGTMDIYKYQKLYRNGVVTEPLPHLMIIADEFAELKSQQSEFMEQLISTARIGRSLGVHLILATQKPSGVVSDQIWANSRFKVCLKVQDRADSMEMLKRPDAAELVETGRFYLQVGYNELFELGQSAWCGAPYIPSEVVESGLDESVELIDYQGNVLEEAKQKKALDLGKAKKQIVEIVQYLTQIAEEEDIKANPLWLPEIPARITVEQMERKYQYQSNYALNPVIGELDDPFNQEQRLLTLPLSERGNAICYGSAVSGKEEFLTTVLYSLYRSHTSSELNTYILDFGAETLQIFAEAPQTGDFVVSGEDEKITNLFRMLGQEVAARKKKFSLSGGDYLSYCKQGNTDVVAIVVVINEYANFAEQYEELDERMASITRECTKYGIYFVITNSSQVGIRFKLQQNFSQVFVLQMNDKTDYMAILGNTAGVYPSKIYGRGIYREKDVYEFQTACVTAVREKITDAVRSFCKALGERSSQKAKAIPVIPGVVYREHIGELAASFERVPLGLDISTVRPVCMNLRKGGVELVLAVEKQDIIAFAEGLAGVLQEMSDCELYLLDPDKLMKVEEIHNGHYVVEELEDTVAKLFWTTVERHNAYKMSGEEAAMKLKVRPTVIIVMGLGQTKKQLSDDARDKLKVMMEKASGRYGIFFWAMDDYQSSHSYSTESWCNGEGIWIGNGIEEQVRLKVSRRNPAFVRKVDLTNGFWVRKTGVTALKLLISKRMGREMEAEYEEE